MKGNFVNIIEDFNSILQDAVGDNLEFIRGIVNVSFACYSMC